MQSAKKFNILRQIRLSIQADEHNEGRQFLRFRRSWLRDPGFGWNPPAIQLRNSFLGVIEPEVLNGQPARRRNRGWRGRLSAYGRKCELPLSLVKQQANGKINGQPCEGDCGQHCPEQPAARDRRLSVRVRAAICGTLIRSWVARWRMRDWIRFWRAMPGWVGNLCHKIDSSTHVAEFSSPARLSIGAICVHNGMSEPFQYPEKPLDRGKMRTAAQRKEAARSGPLSGCGGRRDSVSHACWQGSGSRGLQVHLTTGLRRRFGERAVMDGEERQFEPVGNTGLVIDVTEVVLDHLLGRA